MGKHRAHFRVVMKATRGRRWRKSANRRTRCSAVFYAIGSLLPRICDLHAAARRRAALQAMRDCAFACSAHDLLDAAGAVLSSLFFPKAQEWHNRSCLPDEDVPAAGKRFASDTSRWPWRWPVRADDLSGGFVLAPVLPHLTRWIWVRASWPEHGQTKERLCQRARQCCVHFPRSTMHSQVETR